MVSNSIFLIFCYLLLTLYLYYFFHPTELNDSLLPFFDQKADFNRTKDKYLTKYLFNSKKNIGCEWPSGHPDEVDFNYCGENKVEGKPYCPKHCAKAYIVTEKLKGEEVAA